MSQSDETKIAVLQIQMDNLEKKVDSIGQKQDTMADKIDAFMDEIRNKYVEKDDFYFWRNILISGIILTIVAAIIARFFHTPLA